MKTKNVVKVAVLTGLLSLLCAQKPRTIKFYSEGFRQGDLVVAQIYPGKGLKAHLSLEDDKGDRREYQIPLYEKNDTAYGLLGTDFRYPAQNAKFTVTYGQTNESYEIEIKPRDFIVQRLPATTQNAAPSNAEDLRLIAQERMLLSRAFEKSADIPWFAHAPTITDCNAASFGSRRIYGKVERSAHSGVDCRGATGDSVVSMLPGDVRMAEKDLFYTGNAVVVDHGFGLETLYAHLNSISTYEGLPAGTKPIGTIGSTGRATAPHLHISAKLQGMTIDPLSLKVLGRLFH